jgi:hypothetical protein
VNGVALKSVTGLVFVFYDSSSMIRQVMGMKNTYRITSCTTCCYTWCYIQVKSLRVIPRPLNVMLSFNDHEPGPVCEA